jgi:hypothetical protein
MSVLHDTDAEEESVIFPIPGADSDVESDDDKEIIDENITLPPIFDTNNSIVFRPQKSSTRQQRFAKRNLNFIWKEEQPQFLVDTPDEDFTPPNNHKSPFDYFNIFFDGAIECIVDASNLYSTQKSGKCINVTKCDIQDFIAIELMMGIMKLSAYTDYWSTDLRVEQVASIMPLKKYQSIRKYLHFANNEHVNEHDRYAKIRPLLDIIRANCLKIEQEKKFSVDEMMIPYKGTRAGSRRQYMQNKPKKWGFKMYCRCGVSGIVYDFMLYGGTDTFYDKQFTTIEMELGITAKIVIALIKSIRDPACSAVYFDNFFTSYELLYHLRNEYGILSLGTIRRNRLRNCPIKNEKTLKKSGRGSYQQLVDNGNKINTVAWYDNKCVLLASTFVGAEPISHIKRYNKEQKNKINIDCPQIVKLYNAHMGGVDLADMLVALYRTNFRTHRWYMSIFSQLLDICVNNAWLLSRRDAARSLEESRHMSLKAFRVQIYHSLLKRERKRGRPDSLQISEPPKKIKRHTKPQPQTNIRFDNVGHLPTHIDKGRCRYCTTGQTTVYCTKCAVRLCFVDKRNCFYSYHTL